MKRIFLSGLFFIAVTTGCDKNGSGGETKTELIARQSWKYENAGVDQDKNGSIDLPPPAGSVPPCLTDFTASFSTNGTGTVDEGPTKCDPSAPQSSTFTWSFANNETVLNISGAGGFLFNGQFKILELSQTRLSLSKDTTSILGPVALVIQLKH